MSFHRQIAESGVVLEIDLYNGSAHYMGTRYDRCTLVTLRDNLMVYRLDGEYQLPVIVKVSIDPPIAKREENNDKGDSTRMAQP